MCRMARCTSCTPCSRRVCLPVHQLRGLFEGDALSLSGGSRRRWRWLLFPRHPGRYASLPLWTGDRTGGQNTKDHVRCTVRDPPPNKMSLFLPGCSAARWRFAPPPPPLHGVPCLSVCSVSRLSVCALSGQFVRQAVDGLVVGQNGADMLLKQCREPQTHTVDLETQ